MGLRALRPDRLARAMAEEHARRMARRGRVYHNPELGTPSGRRRLGSPTIVGENVGVGPSARAIHAAFMRSHKHRRNIVHPSFRLAGIGAFRQGGSLWVVEVFLTRSSGVGGSWSGTAAPSSRTRQGTHTADVQAAADRIRGMAVGTPTMPAANADPWRWSAAATRSGQSTFPAALVGLTSLAAGLVLLRRRPHTARSNA